MAYTRKQVVTVISVVFLGLLLGLAIYAISTIRGHALPIPTELGAFIAALPVLAGLNGFDMFFSGGRTGHNGPKGARFSFRTLISLFGLTVYETVVATLAGTHIGPVAGLNCRLDEKWLELFRNKDETIKRIQDALNCCGLHSVKDKAWPFQSREPKPPCAEAFHRTKSCFAEWRSEEQLMGILLLLVPILVFIWQVLVIADPASRSPWIRQLLPGPMGEDDDNDATSRGAIPRRAIGYVRETEGFSDDPAGEETGLLAGEQNGRRNNVNHGRAPVNIAQRGTSAGDVNNGNSERNEWARDGN